MSKNTVTCSFTMDRDIYDAYKSIVSGNGETVKEDIVKYMMDVIRYGIPNANTIEAIEEVQRLKADPHKKTCGSFAELLVDLDNEEVSDCPDLKNQMEN